MASAARADALAKDMMRMNFHAHGALGTLDGDYPDGGGHGYLPYVTNSCADID